MRKSKKVLLGFLALNSIFSVSSFSAESSGTNYNSLYNKIIKNINSGKTNNENYKIIEKVLNKRNKAII